MKNYFLLPIFRGYEVIPNAFSRLIGGRGTYIEVLRKNIECMLQGERLFIFSDIEEIDTLSTQSDAIELVSVRDYADFKSKIEPFCQPGGVCVIFNPLCVFLSDEYVNSDLLEPSGNSQMELIETEDTLDHFLEKLFEGYNLRNRRSLFFRCSAQKIECADMKAENDQCIFINSFRDYILADRLLRKKKIIFRVEGYLELGLGHIYNCITLASLLYEHQVLFVISKSSKEGIEKLRETGLPYVAIRKEDELAEIIASFSPDIWVNDCLDTGLEYISWLKKRIPRVITIEDLGSGTKRADAVINALYNDTMLSGENIYNGWKYVCLRDEFQVIGRNKFSREVKKVLIMFGGTDPTNMNGKIYPIAEKLSELYQEIEFHFIVGLGYDAQKYGISTNQEKRIFIHSNVRRVTKYMTNADIAITSQGRTIFELAAMCIPSIVISHNHRESKHDFAQMSNGFLNLGMAENMDAEMLQNTLIWLINTPNIRKNMYDIMYGFPLRSGIKRVKEIILDDIGI